MLDSKSLSIFRSLFADEVNQRREALGREIAALKSEATSKGALKSGRVRLQIQELCKRELRIRTQIAWELLQRVLSAAGVQLGGSLATDLKESLHAVMTQQTDELFGVMRDQLKAVADAWDPSLLATEHTSLERTFDAKVDLLVLELTQRTTSPAGTVNNFYGGTYGAVVTGAGTATVTQSISDSDSAALLQALAVVEQAVNAAADLAEGTRRDVLDVVRELVGELKKPEEKNRLRITQLASGVAMTLQTAASLRPAFDTMKGVLIAMGIAVPL